MNKIVMMVLSFFDYFHKRKIINFFIKNNFKEIPLIIDVGGHKGESIKLFLHNFKVHKIISFEASSINFKQLKKIIYNIKKKYLDVEIVLENLAIGEKRETLKINQQKDSSSSTLNEINYHSLYFKKKQKLLNFFSDKIYNNPINTDVETLSNYIEENEIKKIDLIKIDTEGYEFKVVKSLDKHIKNVKIFLFEHHYDDMIRKNYKFSDIHTYLVQNNFQKVYKSKMPFRKSFDYIYINKKF